MNYKVYKWCAVPLCKNTSIATPNKLFVYVPNKKTVRDKWLKLARRDPEGVVTNSALYFCEDHFDLPNDMENYMQYHLMGSVSQVRMKPGCIPKKFACQPNRETQTSDTIEQLYFRKKRKRMAPEECEKQLEEIEHFDFEEIDSRSSVQENFQEAQQVTSKMVDKSVQLENDLENYVKWKLVGGRKFLKKGVIPHRFDCQSDRKRKFTGVPSKTALKQRRTEIVKTAVQKFGLKEGVMENKDHEELSKEHIPSTASEFSSPKGKCFQMAEAEEECKNQELLNTAQDLDGIHVTIKEEEIDDTSPTIKVEPGDADIKTETFSCKNCNVPVPSEDTLCDTCRQDETEAPHVTELIKIEPDQYLQYSGFDTPQSFLELLDYIKGDLPDIDGCDKSNQLLSVLAKLHFNNDHCYISQYRFPYVYVKAVSALCERLQFIGTGAFESDSLPDVLQSCFVNRHARLVIFDVLNVKIESNRGLDKELKFLIGYTSTGKVFYVSESCLLNVAFAALVEKSGVLESFNGKDVWWIVYRQLHDFMMCEAPNFGVSGVKVEPTAENYFREVCSRLKEQFQILDQLFPSYYTLETNGGSFLKKTVSACCALLNYKLFLYDQ